MDENSKSKENLFFEELKKSCSKEYPQYFALHNSDIRKAILKASDQYIFDNNLSLWKEDWFKKAYLNYFIFTQSARFIYLYQKVKSFLPSSYSRIVDFGCGPGNFEFFARHYLGIRDTPILSVDKESGALDIAQKINPGLQTLQSDAIPPAKSPRELLLLSFSYCEGFELKELESYQDILILEPGTKESSKKIIELRQKLLASGFHVLAPCTHQESCPMEKEKKHWCHDHCSKPKFLNELQLPFSDHKLNFSYLFMSKRKLTNTKDQRPARVIGDLRKEKGKSKIAVCEGTELKYLSWLKKSKLNLTLNRGDLIDLKMKSEEKANEIRVQENIKKLESINNF